ncbi:hypothetical protein JEQ47_18460 [Devosia sp. MSA67]|uniref:HTH luxR-type domain-containing protein n=2 Tax=Devosia sediminis TaxID=2798801 RepID=A0A934ITZ1_9HYPH|nr:hypothetical protein [Devosia sediminis]
MAVMIGDAPSTDTVVAAMKLGAVDVLAIPVDHENLLRVVREGLQADVHFHAAKGGRRAVDVLGFSELTSREREVLQMVADGQSNKETGRALKISPRTVEVHRARVMAKLGARNAADLMRIVLTT